jgi:hypothetical protein
MASNIMESQQRPTDRPSKLWCRACDREDRDYTMLVNGVRVRLPNDVSTVTCGKCKCFGSLVWRYSLGQSDPTYRAPAAVKPAWKPHCGDPACTGLCTDPECIPPEKPLAPVTAGEVVSTRDYIMDALYLGTVLAGVYQVGKWVWALFQ